MQSLLRFSIFSVRRTARSGSLHIYGPRFANSYLYQVFSVSKFSTFKRINENQDNTQETDFDMVAAKEIYNRAVALSTEDPSESVEQYKKFLEIIKGISGSEMDQIQCHNNIGRLLFDSEKYEEACLQHQEALKIAKNIKNLDVYEKSQLLLTETYMKMADKNVYSKDEVREKLTEYAKEALHLSTQMHGELHELDKLTLDHYEKLANVLLLSKHYTEAEEIIEKIMEILPKVTADDKHALADYYAILGEVQVELGRTIEGVRSYQKAFKVEENYLPDIGKSNLDALGQEFLNLGDYDSSLKALHGAHEKSDSKDEIEAEDLGRYMRLGNIYINNKKNAPEAIRWINEGLKLVPRLADKNLQEQVLIEYNVILSNAYELNKDFKSVVEVYTNLIDLKEKQRLPSDKEMKNTMSIFVAYNMIGQANLELQDYDEARKAFQKGCNLLASIYDSSMKEMQSELVVNKYCKIAKRHKGTNPALAYEIYKQALKFASEYIKIDDNSLMSLHKDLSDLAVELGLNDQATEHLEAYLKSMISGKTMHYNFSSLKEDYKDRYGRIGEQNMKRLMNVFDLAEKKKWYYKNAHLIKVNSDYSL